MSVQSVKNGILQLGELIISNERYSGATGYLASTSTFSAGVTGTSLAVDGPVTAHSFSTTTGGTSLFDDIEVAGKIQFDGPVGATVNLSCTANNILTATGNVSASTFSTTATGTSTFDDITSVGSISALTFSTTAAGTSTFDDITSVGIISAPTFSGGIGGVNGSLTAVSLVQYGQVQNSFTITNFVASPTATFVVSCKGIPYAVLFTCSPLSISGTSTIVQVIMTNIGVADLSATVEFGVIGIN